MSATDDPKNRTDVSEDLQTAEDPTEADDNRKSRRQFFAGALTTIGAGLVVGASGKLLDSEKSATEIRSRIVSRIQKELASSRADDSATYDKTDGGHGKYTKADPFDPKPIEEIQMS